MTADFVDPSNSTSECSRLSTTEPGEHTFTSTEYSGCTSSSHGGAVHIAHNDAKAHGDDCVFVECHSNGGMGGGAYAAVAMADVTRSRFRLCSARMNLASCLFAVSTNGPTTVTQIAAILGWSRRSTGAWNSGVGYTNCDLTNLTENSATQDGCAGIYYSPKVLTLQFCIFDSNIGQHGLYFSSTPTHSIRCLIVRSHTCGGSLFYLTAVSMSESLIVNNTAESLVSTSGFTFSGCLFDRFSGSALYSRKGSADSRRTPSQPNSNTKRFAM
jgi:hypothetical protein